MAEQRNTEPNTQKALIRFLLEQVKDQRLDKKTALDYLKYLEGKKGAGEPADAVAIIGLACRFPDADNKDDYWHNLAEGRASIRPFPVGRKQDLAPLDEGATPLFNGGFLDDVSQFDNDYFNIPPAVANHMDPYHRLLLESFIETLEDAGYSRTHVQGRNIGVYTGNDHTHRLFNSYLNFIDEPDFNSITGSWTGVLASRIAYLLNLQGPAMVIDTACSSALVALDVAMKALHDGDCEAALIGAANLFFAPGKGIVGDVENDDFVVRAFDQGASGTVWGEGVASLLIKPLKAALKDGDAIYGVVQGIAVNNDGASNGITAPNARAQQQVLTKAWERAGISPEALSYIESHGTGTHLGDPIEIRGLTNAISRRTQRRQFCGIGSVKTNIGHTVGVAGLASLIKVLLSYQHEQLPPSLNFVDPNPLIDFCNSPVYVNDRLSAWPAQVDRPRYAGISAFSLSGTNCHVVLRDHFVDTPVAEARPLPFVLSARSPALLLETIQRHLDRFAADPGNFSHACYTAAVGREHQAVRLAVVADGMGELTARLQQAHDALSAGAITMVDDACIGEGIWYSEALLALPPSLAALEKEAANIITEAGPGTLTKLARYYVSGARLEWAALFTPQESQRRHLPPRPWQHQRFWLSPAPRVPGREAVQESAKSLQQQLAEIVAQPSRIVGVGEGDDAESRAEKTVAWLLAETLGYDSLNATDDYYALGGDSVLGAKISHLIHAALGIDAPIAELMGAASIGDFIREQAKKSTSSPVDGSESVASANAIPVLPTVADYPLSRAQERMFILADLVADPSTYNVNALLQIDTIPEREEIERVLRQLIQRHEILRTGFRLQEGVPRQFVLAASDIELPVHVATLPEGPEEEALKQWLKEAVQPFDLARPPLFRVSFASRADLDHSYMVIDMHHIVTDGTSMGVLVGEYLQLAAGRSLPPLPIQYRDFADWHNRLLASESFTVHAQYWRDRYAEPVPEARLPLDFARPPVQQFDGARWHSRLPASLTSEIKTLAASHGVSLFMLLNAAFRVLLYKYQVGRDVVLGTPVSGRNHPQLDSLIGMFVNTLALRFELQPQSRFSDMLEQIKTTLLADFSHQDYPFEALVASLELSRDTSRNPLFDIYFVLQNEDMGLGGEGVSVIPHDTGTARFDLTLVLREEAGPEGICLSADWEYATALFSQTTIARMANHFEHLLAAVCRQPASRIADLPLLSESERHYLLEALNDTATDYPADMSLNALFERHATANPQRTALRYLGADETLALSYGEMNRRANQLAHYLTQQGATAGQVVALYLPRRPEMVVAILATLKLGCAYVPVDADNPPARSLDILDDSGAAWLLGHTSMQALEGCPLPMVEMDRLVLDEYPDTNPDSGNHGDSLAYLMYTSGTTGRPKGACIRHKSVSRVVVDTNYLHLDETDVCLQMSSFAFDGCVPDLFGALLNGGLLVLPTREATLDMPALGRLIAEHGVTSMFVTTSLFNVMVDNILPALKGMKNVIFGGEAGSPTHVRKALAELGPGRLINGYGPTETTVFAVTSVIDRLDDRLGSVPIGRTMSNTRAYVLDDQRELVPLGVAGELYIGGDGVALGYLNREAMTAERFVPNPFLPGDTLYRTGDLVKYLDDGTMVYIGRRDMQVKIRGFRIELEEIRKAICDFTGIVDAAVTADPDASGMRQLLAWVVTPEAEQFDTVSLSAWLRARLPDYMVPHALMPLPELPLTLNGKLDRARLPLPELGDKTCVGASNDLEQQLLDAWSEVLNLPEIGIHDNFFALGGDSIKGIRLVARLHQVGIVSTIADLFQFPTIEALAANLVEQASVATLVDQGPVIGELILNPVQRWFFATQDAGIGHFNHVMWLPMTEALPDEQTLVVALREVTRHHDALRTCFQLDEAGVWHAQIPAPEKDQFVIRHYRGGPWGVGETATDDSLLALQATLCLEEGVNLAVGLFESERGENAMCVAVHHLVIDVVSWPILLDDFQRCLASAGEAVSLPSKTRSFSEWNRMLQDRANDPAVLASADYWSALANQEQRHLAEGDNGATLADCAIRARRLDKALTQDLMTTANQAYTTEPQHLLLAALARACELWRGRGATLIQLEGHGRHGLDNADASANLERTVGWFTTVYPHLLPAVGDDLGAAVIKVKEDLRAVPGRGRDFGLLAWLSDALEEAKRASLRNMNPQIGFNFLGAGEAADTQVIPLPRTLSSSPVISQPLVLDLVLSVTDEQLVIEALYDGRRLSAPELDEFLNCYTQALVDISDFCLSREGGERTASDYSASNLRQDELEDVYDDLELA